MSTKYLKNIGYAGSLLGISLAGLVFAAPESFNKDLYFGLRGDADVVVLQEFLTKEGFYSGPQNGNFYSLTKGAVIAYQKANSIQPASGYFGAITRAKANSRLGGGGVAESDRTLAIQALQEQITILLKQLALLQPSSMVVAPPSQEAATSTPVVPDATTTPSTHAETIATTTPAAPSVFDSTLQIKSTYRDYTMTRFSAVVLGEFSFSADEKIAITKLKLKNTGTLVDDSIHGLQLINARTSTIIATASLENGTATFVMTPDSTKIDKGLVVSGETYTLLADSISASTYGVRYTVGYDIQSALDISAFDYNDLSRIAQLKKATFPVVGSYIKTY